MATYAAVVFGVGFCIGVVVGRWRALYVTLGLGGIYQAIGVAHGGDQDTVAVLAIYGAVVVAVATVGTAGGVAARCAVCRSLRR